MRLACLECGAEFTVSGERDPACPECGCADETALVPVDAGRLTGGISDDVLDALAPRVYSDDDAIEAFSDAEYGGL